MLRQSAISVLVLAGLVSLAKGCSFVFPDGVPTGAPAPYTGIVTVPREGWDFALFTSSDLLAENERLSGSGKQVSSITCFEPASAEKAFGEVVQRTTENSEGSRHVLVSFVAAPKLSTGPCVRKYDPPRANRIRYGTYLEVRLVKSARPLGCDYLQYVLNHLRCPNRASAPPA